VIHKVPTVMTVKTAVSQCLISADIDLMKTVRCRVPEDSNIEVSLNSSIIVR